MQFLYPTIYHTTISPMPLNISFYSCLSILFPRIHSVNSTAGSQETRVPLGWVILGILFSLHPDDTHLASEVCDSKQSSNLFLKNKHILNFKKTDPLLSPGFYELICVHLCKVKNRRPSRVFHACQMLFRKGGRNA